MSNVISERNQILQVSNFLELIQTDFVDHKNAICWKRNLEGDFKEIVSQLKLKDKITEISKQELLSLQLSKNGNAARETILNDLKLLEDYGAKPSLNLIKNYERDDVLDFISTDVYSYHVDRSPIPADTFLCTYEGAASDILPNEQATQKIKIPEIREKLKELHTDEDGDFETFLKDYYFDLHYQASSSAKPINLENGNLWRLAVDHPEQKVYPAFIELQLRMMANTGFF